MIIELHSSFKKAFKKRISFDRKLAAKVASRIELFQKNPTDPILRDHQLTGKQKELRSFWVTGDVRIVYFVASSNRVIFLDIGSHNQVY